MGVNKRSEIITGKRQALRVGTSQYNREDGGNKYAESNVAS